MKNTKKDQDLNTDNQVDQIAILEQTAAENLAGWKKALADYQNLQRESEQRIVDLKALLINNIVLDLLPIFDNYQTAIKHIPEAEQKSAWAVGLEHILKMWQSFLNEQEIELIPALGENFDPNIHEAIGQINDSKIADQAVVEEKQAGYKIKDQIIRPAKVIINNLE